MAEAAESLETAFTNVAERDLISVVEDIRVTIAANINLPSGYYLEYGGQFESAEAAGTRLLFLGVIVIVGIFLLLVAAFGTARNAGLVMLNLPLALIGVILIDHITRLMREQGLDVESAVRLGAEERLVLILMTALATALALVPLSLAGGEPGSEIQAPMAVVILWRLASSTALNILVVPAMFLRCGAPIAAPTSVR